MGLLQSMSSIAYIGLLLGMLFYLYAVVGVSMFGVNDPVHMGTLHITLLTLFRCATLEDWSDIMYIATTGIAHGGLLALAAQLVVTATVCRVRPLGLRRHREPVRGESAKALHGRAVLCILRGLGQHDDPEPVHWSHHHQYGRGQTNA